MNDIDRLKQLLFGNEKKALDAITRRLETPESRTADVSDVLPEAILRSHASDPRLTRALEEPVEVCIKNSIRKDPHDFADVLFPVIGPAIRKSIADALRSMTQSLNQAIENSLSVRMRYRAWRAGVPLGQFILQRSLVYCVEQAFLIKRSDGLLVEHVHNDDVLSRDSDAVSAMFTAIQDFIQDSFQQGAGENLTTAVMGELSLWAVHGPSAVLVCVIRGVPPAGLRTELSEIVESIHLGYGDALNKYDGHAETVAGIEFELEKCLLLERRQPEEETAGKKPIGALVFLVLLIGLLAWWAGSAYSDKRRLAGFRAALENTPGIVVNDVRRSGGKVIVRGLRDPLAAAVTEIAPAAHIDRADLQLELASYQSLDGPIVERRARRILKPPRGVGLSLDGTWLRITGSAPAAWKQRALEIGAAIPGVAAIDISGMTLSDDEILAQALTTLEPPETVRLTVNDSVLSGAGTAPAAWLDRAARQAGSIAGIRSADFSRIAPDERIELARLLQVTDGTEVFFANNDILRAGQGPVLDRLASDLRSIGQTAAVLGLVPRVSITAYSDGAGSAGQNATVRRARAARVAERLVASGVSAAWIETGGSAAGSDGTVNPAQRKVVVRVGVSGED